MNEIEKIRTDVLRHTRIIDAKVIHLNDLYDQLKELRNESDKGQSYWQPDPDDERQQRIVKEYEQVNGEIDKHLAERRELFQKLKKKINDKGN